MRRVRYVVAMIMDPDIDFRALFEQFDTFLLGLRTFESMGGARGGGQQGVQTIGFSQTLRQEDYPNLTIVSENPEQALADLKAMPGKDIWLFGGGELFRTLLDADLVDTVEPAIVPVLLGDGIPMLPSPAVRTKLSLSSHRLYPKSGIVLLNYDV